MPWGAIILVVSVVAGLGLAAFFSKRNYKLLTKKEIDEDLTDKQDGWIRQSLKRLATKRDEDLLDQYMDNYDEKRAHDEFKDS